MARRILKRWSRLIARQPNVTGTAHQLTGISTSVFEFDGNPDDFDSHAYFTANLLRDEPSFDITFITKSSPRKRNRHPRSLGISAP
jgi:hypothetical protein